MNSIHAAIGHMRDAVRCVVEDVSQDKARALYHALAEIQEVANGLDCDRLTEEERRELVREGTYAN